MKWQIATLVLAGLVLSIGSWLVPLNRTYENAANSEAHTFSLPALFYGEQNEISHEFFVKNNSAESIQVERIVTTCTCSEVSLAEHEIPPNSQTSLRLTANIQGREGFFDAICVLHVSNHVKKMYSLSAHIYQHISVTPPHFFLAQIDPRSRIVCGFRVDVYSRNEIISQPTMSIDGTDSEDITFVLKDNISDLLDSGMFLQRTFWELSFFPTQSIGAKNLNFTMQIDKTEGLHKIIVPVVWSVDLDFGSRSRYFL